MTNRKYTPWPDVPSGGGADKDYDGDLIAALRDRLDACVTELRDLRAALSKQRGTPNVIAKLLELEELIRHCQEPTP